MSRGARRTGGAVLAVLAAVALGGAVVLGRTGFLEAGFSDLLTTPVERAELPAGVPAAAEPALVHRIVDGDTVRVRVDDPDHSIGLTTSIRVRLLNIDAPEPARDGEPGECGAEEASARLEALLPRSSVVWLAPDLEDRDRFDRPLRYAFTEDGVDVQAVLVEEGLAEVVVFPPNDRFADALRPLEAAAQAAGRGIWGELCPA